jgi:glutamyl-tRNA synthetase
MEHISSAGPVFDVAKLNWLNGRYIRERYDRAAFAQAVQSWGFDDRRLRRIAELAQPRIERLSDLGSLVAFFFEGRVNVTAEQLRGGKLDDESMRKAFQLAMWGFDALTAWDLTEIEGVLKGVSQTLGRKFRDIARPFYLAVTGSPTSVPLYDAIDLLGRDIVRERLRYALELLGGVTSAEQQAWKALEPRGAEEESVTA